MDSFRTVGPRGDGVRDKTVLLAIKTQHLSAEMRVNILGQSNVKVK